MTAQFFSKGSARGRMHQTKMNRRHLTTSPHVVVLVLALLACRVPGIASERRIGNQFGRRHSSTPCRPESTRSVVSRNSALAIPRGGGGFFGDRFPLFGRRRRRSGYANGNGGGDDDDNHDKTLYPPLTRDEIEEKLNLPAYCVTDAEGTGIAVMGENAAGIQGNNGNGNGNSKGGFVYLFLSREMANEALRLAKIANQHIDGLKVTALHLGKVWFKLLHNDNVSVTMKQPGTETTRNVRFRLVPGARDLVGARVLLGLTPPEAEALRIALEPSVVDSTVPSDVDGARSIIERATENSPAFKTPFDEVPVFLMPRMRVTRPDLDGGNDEPKLPLFLSSKNMVKTFLDMARENPEIMASHMGGGNDQQPIVQLVELGRIVEMMQEESEMDFRNVVILPPVEEEEGKSEEDDDSDDDDDGGGGDFGIAAEADEPAIDGGDYAPFVSMEVSVFGEGQELVPMQ